ncbi:MAG: zinc ribbon domain-containing protein [Nevskia sp.]|nr:zinc ribbon domain-containing protein [Nevskia sp.]
MSYEYNPESTRFELPNPHRVENLFLGAASVICLVCAVVALLGARHSLQAGSNGAAVAPVAISAVLLLFGLVFGVKALRQLRFFFGRNQPVGLAPQLPKDVEGSSPDGDGLRETIRQNAINYSVPTGAIDNLLYSLVRDLVFSPHRTQYLARAEFHNALGLGFLLLCFGVSIIGVGSGAVRGWVGALYFLLVNAIVLLPLRQGALGGRKLSIRAIVAFIIAAMIGPVLLAQVIGSAGMPFNGAVQFVPVTVAILVAALIAASLLLKAAVAQVVRPNQIAMAQRLHTISMNAPPGQIFLEFDREMQRGWTETVPNRIYLRKLPTLGSAPAGSFEGHAIEETQPLPNDMEPLSLSRCLRLDTYRWLLMLDAFALLATASGAGMALYAAQVPQQWGAMLIGLSLLLIARFGFDGGNALWRRFEFTSRIYWLETHGNYQRAQTSIGTLLQDRVKTQKEIVNVEDMSLRLWVAEVDTVSFGPDTERSLLSIRGLPDEAERLSAHLADFGVRQASIIAPSSQTDLQRLAVLDKINPPQNAGGALPAGVQQALGVAPAPATSATRFCTQCGTPAHAGAGYCGRCGTRLPALPTAS